MTPAGVEDFSDKRIELKHARVAKFPLKGPRRGGKVVRIGESEYVGAAMLVHGNAERLVIVQAALGNIVANADGEVVSGLFPSQMIEHAPDHRRRLRLLELRLVGETPAHRLLRLGEGVF